VVLIIPPVDNVVVDVVDVVAAAVDDDNGATAIEVFDVASFK
jgi:hypothetical protein